ncbi:MULTISPECIES: ribosomal-processing cysteine protease Prp [Bacillus]|uniref:ribosomal-processing cysteine protease Prp n=1 Tax=Bacillus TaxID=1386 RepID=UPI0008720507|nr:MULTISPECIES: ribosomal-processing cysteine protease Prp [unclassified Bacillus cereus group]OFC92744.1 hypothetical protein BTGOE5_53680 [Bacillus thuringiensis]HDR7323212.1 ribosomal-processing cysteine protease Prp [Bacillus toyonensis]HDR8475988.1 ribosomal-processing cysteine protease Prp [Bacillus cereus]MBJ8050170.1 ribosomal-processing cysteine protease Prp [Bacillus cereus group sp. N18]OFD01766.1 hypothetical protein BTGOE7_55350 [Bacillus thuringiensis]
MISVSVLIEKPNYIQGFIVEGHADYASYGEDIVCSSVSTVTIGTVNSIEKLCHVEMEVETRDGYLRAMLPTNKASQKEQNDVQLLLQAMVYTLQCLEENYEKYIRIIFRKMKDRC